MRLLVTVVCLCAGMTVSADAEDRKDVCTLVPMRTGVCQLGEDHLLGEGHSVENRVAFTIYAFYVESLSEKKALVDLGPKSVGYLNDMFRRYGLFRDLGPELDGRERFPDDIVQPEGNVLDHLRWMKIEPNGIDHIVFSHLHSDHHGMDNAKDGGAAEDFARAMFHVSAIGWKDNLEKRIDGGWNSYVDYAFADFLVKRETAGKVRFRDNAEIFPGVRTMYCGGHSVCSQAVIVRTSEGPAILTGDDMYLYQLLQDNILPQIRTTEAKYRESLDRLARLAVKEDAILIPSHDPIVWKTYRSAGSNWLRELKKISDRAVKSYLRAR